LPIVPQLIDLVVSAQRNADDAGEDARAMRAYRAVLAAFWPARLHPYRIGNQSAGALPATRDGSGARATRFLPLARQVSVTVT
jgi:hypothetical protein